MGKIVKESVGGFIGLKPCPQFTPEQIKEALDARKARLEADGWIKIKAVPSEK